MIITVGKQDEGVTKRTNHECEDHEAHRMMTNGDHKGRIFLSQPQTNI